jgi:hypothetical protein
MTETQRELIEVIQENVVDLIRSLPDETSIKDFKKLSLINELVYKLSETIGRK